MAQIEGKDHYRVAQEAFQAECRTESMVREGESMPCNPETQSNALRTSLGSDSCCPLSAVTVSYTQAAALVRRHGDTSRDT